MGVGYPKGTAKVVIKIGFPKLLTPFLMPQDYSIMYKL